jgi:hypothetical protein
MAQANYPIEHAGKLYKPCSPVHRMLLNLRLKFHADGSYDKSARRGQ